jgi:hypothetical protein
LERFVAMMPEPTTTATSNAVPANSASDLPSKLFKPKHLFMEYFQQIYASERRLTFGLQEIEIFRRRLLLFERKGESC